MNIGTRGHQIYMRHTLKREDRPTPLSAIPGHLGAVRKIVLNPNVPNVYDRLKETILRHFLPSREERSRTLLARYLLGDAKPSHHLTRLQSLTGPTTADSEIVKELWLEPLPVHIQPTITALLEYTPLNQVALIVDKILARTNTRDDYIVASTSRSNVDLDASRLSAQGDRGSCIHTRLNFRNSSNIPEPCVPRVRSRSRKAKAVTTRPKRASPKPRQRDGFRNEYGLVLVPPCLRVRCPPLSRPLLIQGGKLPNRRV
ncbi:unnamed protein product, partial [Schistosoma curassoni]|uniref:Uncharacterized protein n=1 Tax=Schistosoma curassoni TaxID=6186 RepID=A0A183JYF8_9TREM